MKQFVPGFTANHWWSRDLIPGGPGSRAHSVQLLCVCVVVAGGGVVVTYCLHCWTVSCLRAATSFVLLTVVVLVPG